MWSEMNPIGDRTTACTPSAAQRGQEVVDVGLEPRLAGRAGARAVREVPGHGPPEALARRRPRPARRRRGAARGTTRRETADASSIVSGIECVTKTRRASPADRLERLGHGVDVRLHEARVVEVGPDLVDDQRVRRPRRGRRRRRARRARPRGSPGTGGSPSTTSTRWSRGRRIRRAPSEYAADRASRRVRLPVAVAPHDRQVDAAAGELVARAPSAARGSGR